MKVQVLKPFTYSADGIHSRSAAKGDEVDIPDALVPGLVKEGFIAAPQPGLFEAADDAAQLHAPGSVHGPGGDTAEASGAHAVRQKNRRR